MGKLSLRGTHGAFKEVYRRLVAVQGLKCSSPDTCCSRSCLKILPLGVWQPLYLHASGPWASPTWFCADQRLRRKESSPRADTWRWWTEALWAEGGFTLHPSGTPLPSCRSLPANLMTIHLGAQDWETNSCLLMERTQAS